MKPKLGGGEVITAFITNEVVAEFGLGEGMKASDVMIGVG